MLTPVGYLLGAVTADYVLEFLMQQTGALQSVLSVFIGSGSGAGIGLLFVIAGISGIVFLTVFKIDKDKWRVKSPLSLYYLKTAHLLIRL
ncbi:MAG: hypothetical protein LUE96_02845 [Lachnospiraceae bacterium]|nr:hypothetical protein [Lachnospiraceae bacterium]